MPTVPSKLLHQHDKGKLDGRYVGEMDRYLMDMEGRMRLPKSALSGCR